MASKILRSFQGQIGKCFSKICGCANKAKDSAAAAGDAPPAE